MKEVNFFSHDFGARNDPKLQDVLRELGLEGIGAYWCVIEQLYEQGGELPIKSIKSIAFALHVDCKVIDMLINDFELFDFEGEKFFSRSVNARLNKMKSISEARKKAALKRWQSKRNENEESKCNANAMQDYANKIKENIYKEDIPKGISKKTTRFSPPTLEEVKAYILEKGYTVDAERWFYFYESKGWMVGKNKMKNWHAAIATWQKSEPKRNNNNKNITIKNCNDEWE